MPFYLKKRIKIAKGVNLNISKSGLGVSAGVKGARISHGPRGTQINAGVGPMRYRKSLRGRGAAGGRRQSGAAVPEEDQPSVRPGAGRWLAYLVALLLLALALWIAFAITGWLLGLH